MFDETTPTPLSHARRHGTDQVEGATVIDADLPAPGLRLHQLQRRDIVDDSGTVYEAGDCAERRGNFSDGRVDSVGVGNVNNPRSRVAASLDNGCRGLLNRRRPIEQGDLRAFPREPQRRGAADAARRSRNKD